MQQQNTVHIKYRPDVDGLRAIAIISVAIFHAFPSILRGGFSGVDVFFVISGYLISSIIYKNSAKNKFSFVDFYQRRVKRIFPPLIIVLASLLVIGWFTMLAEDYKLLGKHTLASALFAQNYNLFYEINYFDAKSDLKPLLHLWSLAVEEQFYILLPPVILLMTRTNKKLIPITCAIIFMSFAWNAVQITLDSSYAFYAIQGRIWELMAGALLAFREFEKPKLIRHQNFAATIGLIMLLIGFFIIPQKRFPGWWALLPVIGTCLLISARTSWINQKVLSAKPMLGLGLFSFSFYLWHWPLLVLLRLFCSEQIYLTTYFAFLKIIAIAIALLLSVASYFAVEKPLRKALPNTKTTITFTLSLIFIAASGFLILHVNGFEERASAKQPDLAPYEKNIDETLLPQSCGDDQSLPGIESCKFYGESNATDIVVMGDSHSLSYAPALRKYFPNRSIRFFETGDTPALLDVGWYDTGPFSISGRRNMNSAFDWILGHQPKSVILVFRGPAYVTHEDFGVDQGAKPIVDFENENEKNTAQIFETGLRRTFKKLESISQIVFFYDNPELGFTPKRACFKPPFTIAWPEDETCGVSREDYNQRQAKYRQIISKVLGEFPKVQTFDPEPYLCNQTVCSAMQNHELLYLDANHLTPSAALKLSEHFKF